MKPEMMPIPTDVYHNSDSTWQSSNERQLHNLQLQRQQNAWDARLKILGFKITGDLKEYSNRQMKLIQVNSRPGKKSSLTKKGLERFLSI